MLGGPFLNSMEMVMATDPTERMKMLSDAVNDAGVSFDDMGYYQRKALTEAMGLEDVSQLARVMAGDFDTMGSKSNQSQAELVALANQTEDFNTLMDELTQTMRAFALSMRPVISFLKGVMEGLQSASFGLKILAYVIFPAAIIGVSVLTIKTMGFAAALGAASGGLIPLLGLLTMGLLYLFKDNGIMASGIVIVAGLTIGIYALAVAFGVASAGIIPLIGIIVMAITAVGKLIYDWFQADVGASTFLEGLVKVGHAFAEIGVGMLFAAAATPMLIAAILALLAMTVPLAISTLPGGAFWSLSTGLGWIADAMDRMDTSKISALTTLFSALAEVTAEAAENISLMGSGVAQMASGFTAMSLNPVALAMAPAIMAGTAMTKAAGGGGTNSATNPQKLLPLTVNVELDGKKLGKFVQEVIVKELNYNQG